jgi:uncharacterized protein with NAD-binding domain and iron-sulfur cluster
LTVAVLGGGFAGLQAAIALRQRSVPIVLLERRGILGGRASSYRDARSGDEVDNGVHVLFGAHAAAQELIRSAGAGPLLAPDDRRGPTWSDGSRTWTLGAARLPAPWHLLPGLLGMGLPARELPAAWRFLRGAGRGAPAADTTLARELVRRGVGPQARRRLIGPLSRLLCLAPPEAVSAELFGTAVRRALVASRRGARPLSLLCGLAELHERLGSHLDSLGGRILRGARAESLELRDGRVRAVLYRQRPREREAIQRGEAGSAERLEVTAVVSALPWHGLPPLLPEPAVGEPSFAQLGRLAGTPAISLAFWLDQRVLGSAWLGVAGGGLCRVGTRERGPAADGSRQMLQALVLPSKDDAKRPNGEIAASCEAELVRALPEAAGSIQRSLVVREPQAAFRQTPDAAGARPAPVTGIRGLFLAGDWTDTGLPASIEGAVRSGHAASEAVGTYLAALQSPS